MIVTAENKPNISPQMFTVKQSNIYRDLKRQDWFMSVLYGAKRTGKTIFNNYVFLNELKRVREIADQQGIKNPQYILAGYSLGTIQKNVLEELYNMYGLEFKFDKYNRFKLFGVTVVQTGHGNVSGLKAIRGMTAYGAYINEGSIAEESVFDEIKSRCSGEGARILVDTNPDHPEHWLLKDYILNPDENIRGYHFELDDNSFLSERYRKNIKSSTPSGMFYDRNIKGLWVSGDGVVYQDFDKDLHAITRQEAEQFKFVEYIAGVDWGYEHYGSIVVIGITADGTHVVLEEHAHQHKEIDFWETVQKKIMIKYGVNIPFYPDTARPEYVYRFSENSKHVYNANKSVMVGIEMVAGLIKQNKFFIVYDECPRFQQEIYNYVWHNTKDEPIKQFDDVMDSIRYAVLSHATNQQRTTIKEDIEALQVYSL